MQRLKDKLQQVEKQLAKSEGLLEVALRERAAVDKKHGATVQELEQASKKHGVLVFLTINLMSQFFKI